MRVTAMSSLRDLKNLGPKSERWLNQIGIHHFEDLRELGAVESYLRLKAQFPEEISLNMLYALQGAILDIPWNQLPEKMVSELRRVVGA